MSSNKKNILICGTKSSSSSNSWNEASKYDINLEENNYKNNKINKINKIEFSDVDIAKELFKICGISPNKVCIHGITTFSCMACSH